MSTKKAQLEIGANSAPAEQAFDRVEKAGRRMGDQVAKEGDKAGEALKGIGDEANKGAKGVDSATKSMIASVQRTTAALQAGERGSAKYFETLAQQRGVDPATLKPYLDQLKSVEAQQTKTGISAAQTAAALRGVPAQFTDIATSLQGGQAPLTVFLQQGGQLKDMFGGAGNAARALGGYVVSLVNPITVAAAAAGVLAVAYNQGSKEADAFRAALVTTGNAAGTSTNQLAGLAAQMGQGFGNTVGKAAEALGQMAATGQVGRASLQDFATTAIMAEKAFGTATADIAKNFADLGKDPVGASNRLNESMNYLTASTYAQIKAAVDMGETSKAAALAQDAYNSALKGRSAEMLASMGYIERAWGGVKSAAKEAWDAMLGVGRPTAVSSEIEKVQKELDKTTKSRQGLSANYSLAGTLDREIEKLKTKLESLKKIEEAEKAAGDSAAERVAKEQAGIQAQKDGLKYLSSEQKMRNDIAQQTATMRKAGYEEAAIQERIAQIKASYDKKGSTKAKEISEYEKLNQRIGEFAALQTAALDADSKLTAGQRLAVQVKQDMAAAGDKLSAGEKQRLQTTLDAALATEQRLGAEKDLAKFMAESQQLQAKAADQADKNIENLAKQAAAEREATAAIGLTKAAIAQLTAAKYEDSAASKERLADIMAEAGEPELLIKKYRAEAAALRDLAAAKRERGDAEATAEAASEAEKISKRAADSAAQDWRRAAESIERGITDSLMRGFESGKSFAVNLRDTLQNMFKTLVLRPYIQAVVGGVTGLGSLGAAAGQGGSMAGMANSLPMLGRLAGASQYIGAGFMNTLAGSGTLGGLQAASSIGGLNGLAMGAGALAPWALGAAAIYKGLQRGPRVTTGDSLVGGFNSAGANLDSVQTWSQKGGWLRSDKSGTISSSIQGSALDQSMDAIIVRMYSKTKEYAKVLGLPADAIDDYRRSINISLQGLSAEERDRKIAEALAGFGDALAGVVGAESMDALQQIAERVLSERGTLELQILGLQGDAVAIRERERAAVHETNRALYDQVKALEDQKTLAQQTMAIMQERTSLQAQIDQLMGNTVAIRERERSALDETNRALYDQIKALEDLRVVNEQQAAVMSERVGLQGQLDQAMGNTVAIRDRERMALDETNRALYDQIKALEDTKTLAEQTAAAMRAEAQEREGLQGQLDLLLGNTAAIRDRERAALSESNRALYDQVNAAEDAQAAAQRTTQAMQEQTAAAEQLQRAWDSIGASIRDQVQSIRNGLAVAQGQGYVALAAQFASATAQARAGDQQAAGSLASISQALLEAAAGKVTSRVEYQRIAALTAASLDATLAATGQPTQAAQAAAGAVGLSQGNAAGATFNALTGLPATLAPAPVSLSPAPMASQQPDPLGILRAELQAMREELAAFRRDNSAENIAIVRQTATTARVLTDVSPTGTAINTRAA